MAKVTVVELGGQPTVKDVGTVADLLSAMNMSNDRAVTVNGRTVDKNYVLKDFEFVSIGEKVKGGA
jgi:sulfur carrier protein ThiS